MTTPSANARFTRETVAQATAKVVADVKAAHTFTREVNLGGQVREVYGPYGSFLVCYNCNDELHATVAVRHSTGVKFPGGTIHGNFTNFKQVVLSGPEELEVAINNILNILAVAKEDARQEA